MLECAAKVGPFDSEPGKSSMRQVTQKVPTLLDRMLVGLLILAVLVLLGLQLSRVG